MSTETTLAAKTYEILHNLLPSGTYALDFTQSTYESLLSTIDPSSSKEQQHEQRDCIKQGIIHYFKTTFQDVSVDLFNHKVSISKVFVAEKIDEKADRIIHRNNLRLIDIRNHPAPHSPIPHLIVVDESTRNEMFSPLIDAGLDIERIRHITRSEATQIFSLAERDIVLFIRGKIAIRTYVVPKKFPAGSDKRYNGESPEEMTELYNHYFPDGAWEEIEALLEEVLPQELNFGEIDNVTFTRSFITVFRSMVEVLLSDIVDKEDYSKIEGFTGFVLRQNFDAIMLYTAKNLLEFVENRDKNAETFIKYFTEDVIIDGAGNKIQKYPILDQKGQKWNYSSVLSVMMQWKQSQKRIASQLEMIQLAQTNHANARNELQHEVAYAKELNEELDDIEKALRENDHELIKVKAHLKDAKDAESTKLKNDYARLSTQYEKLQRQIKSQKMKIESQTIKVNNKTTDVTNKRKKVDYENKTIETIRSQVEPIRESYELICAALAAVLSKR